MKKTAIIIGAGPAGLTAAYELLTKTDIQPIIIEKTKHIGGISKTINYKENYTDIGGHRFFSKSDQIMEWWLRILPLEKKTVSNANAKTFTPAQTESSSKNVMLQRSRQSRIYFSRTFFDYPIKLSPQTLKNLGLTKTFKIGFSYLKSMLFQIKPEKNLADFMINRFGKELYKTFFESYTEKVWGIPCDKISAEWGAQRIKGISIWKTVVHAFKQVFKKKNDIKQKDTETSLIEQFLYPKYGPGQMWQEVARIVQEKGGEIIHDYEVKNIKIKNNNLTHIEASNSSATETKTFSCDYVFSSMPIKDLVTSFGSNAPKHISQISDGLMYRDFLTVGLLVNKLKIKEKDGTQIKDNWIYIQEPDVQVGRLQIFNNWSPYMVSDPNKVWIGLEYFCNEGDKLWNMSDENLIKLAKNELDHIDIIDKNDALDGTVIRQEKAYPAYFGTYDQFDLLKNHLDKIPNLFLIGRNGMHRYNNQDHSMLSAITAVNNIINNNLDKENIWNVNTEKEYHETK
jgi:protoporphyrinogen oxidase